jgi:DNA-binding FadR family transcriptional regulator
MKMYTPIPKNNLSSQIAEHIETLILQQNLKVGDKLPGEIELAEQFGASRNVLREALATLKERGLIEVKNGSGVYVAQVGSGTLGKVVDRLVKTGTASPREVYEIRLALEVQACGQAAKRASDEEIAQLKELVARMERDYKDEALWSEYDSEFHHQLAIMTGNSLYPVILQPLINIVSEIRDAQPPTQGARARGLEDHKMIVSAIEAHDRAAAQQAMVNHLKRFLNDLM